jgi:hypothetical protein
MSYLKIYINLKSSIKRKKCSFVGEVKDVLLKTDLQEVW